MRWQAACKPRRSLSAVQFPSDALPELFKSLDDGVATSVTSCAGANACNDDVRSTSLGDRLVFLLHGRG
jgi:hypothetical protein